MFPPGRPGTLIATGNAAYTIGAFFNNFETQGDFGHLHLDFRNTRHACPLARQKS